MFMRLTRRYRHAPLAAAIVLALGACSGGNSDPSVGPASRAVDEVSNAVIRNEADSVQRRGSFEQIDGYLSQSGKTLRAPAGADLASVTFSSVAEKQGFYEVFAWWPQTGGEGSRARIRISHLEGETLLSVDQSEAGGEWHSLGVHPFEARGGSVVFEQISGAPMLVDAIRIRYVGEQRPDLALPSGVLAVGELDIGYSGRIAGTGGTLPYAYRVVGGALPPGLVLDPGTGRISGRPGGLGSHAFSVEVLDGAGRRALTDFQIEVIESSEPAAAAVGSVAARARGLQAAGAGLDNLVSIVAAMPEGSWRKLNLNLYSEVWTPKALRPLFNGGTPDPSKIIAAWSSFAWDSKRGNLLLYGGGHANYRGNDVYLWRGSTQRWERASLPSESKQDVLGNWNAIDGAGRAPASAHTYDNSVYLPVIDRMLVLGGAADSNGGHYYTANDALTAKRITGPYLFDPAKAHPDRVGGTTGSHVMRVAPYPEVIGGEMWSNRENWLNGTGAPSKNFVDGCTAYARENGQDVVYAYLKTTGVYRYQVTALNEPALDTWTLVGRYWGGPGSQTACGYDPVGKSFVRVATNTTPFVFWDLNKASKTNNDIRLTPTDPSGEFTQALASNAILMKNCGLDFDPERRQYALWCGGGSVWMLEPPATLSASGWAIRKQPLPVGEVPLGSVGVGVMGKWKYIPNLGAFIALQENVQGNVWVYKPVGWKAPEGSGDPGDPGPSNQAPQVAITQPVDGSSYTAGQMVTLAASASDTDGSVVSVEFFANGASIGVINAAPYEVQWPAPVGNHRLTAVATDNAGAQTVSAEVQIGVQVPPVGGDPVALVLQRGVNAYEGVADTYLSRYHQTSSFGASSMIQDQSSYYSGLIRFAIFHSEGGPVPDGAQIESAKLSLYKYTAYDMNYALHRVLKPWREGSATWLVTGLGASWAAAGANGAGVDFDPVPDATAQTPWASGQWVEFDVTEGVRRFAQGGEPGNQGWRIKGVSGYVSGLKRFYTSNYATDAQFRPKLAITYR